MISTHSPRVGRTNACAAFVLAALISTHSPRVGRTLIACGVVVRHLDFNSLAPCGANLSFFAFSVELSIFQLTRPVWGEPYANGRGTKSATNFNSLAPCGANHYNAERQAQFFDISTHSPRVGRTWDDREKGDNRRQFQLTRPVWGEPVLYQSVDAQGIHFNSLAPCGANRLPP